jgi:CIC family chloride channel protein
MSQALVRASGEVVDRPHWSGPWLWLMAIAAGGLVGWVVAVYRFIIGYIELLFFGASGDSLARGMTDLSWNERLIAPIVAGALVALLLRLGGSLGWGKYPRPFGLDDIIAQRRLREPLRVSSLSLRDSFLSGLISMISLGGGAGAGRECPAMHMGASVGLLPGRILGLDLGQRRMLMGAGAAAGLSAILGAPLASIILARELLLPRVRLAALAPLALASGAAWLAARYVGGVQPAISLPHVDPVPILFHVASPVAAALAGLAAAGLAALWSWAPRAVDRLAAQNRFPEWVLPAIGGVLTGVMAIGFPQAIGLGYGALKTGVSGGYSAALMAVVALAKAGTAAIAFSFRFGGGRIGPALVIGGLLGATLGVFVGLPLGEASAGQVYFGVVMMAAVLAGVLDAPLAASVLALELTGSPEVGAACLVGCHISAWIVRRLVTPRRAADERRL